MRLNTDTLCDLTVMPRQMWTLNQTRTVATGWFEINSPNGKKSVFGKYQPINRDEKNTETKRRKTSILLWLCMANVCASTSCAKYTHGERWQKGKVMYLACVSLLLWRFCSFRWLSLIQLLVLFFAKNVGMISVLWNSLELLTGIKKIRMKVQTECNRENTTHTTKSTAMTTTALATVNGMFEQTKS